MSRALPFTLYPSKKKKILLLLLCAAFTAGGVVMIQSGEQMGWFCAGFFSLGIPVFILQLVPGSTYLTVTEEGIEFCALFRTHRVQWSEISEFGVYTLRRNGVAVSSQVGFNYSSDYVRAPKARGFSRALAGFEGGLPDTFGMGAEELAAMLNELLETRVKRAG